MSGDLISLTQRAVNIPKPRNAVRTCFVGDGGPRRLRLGTRDRAPAGSHFWVVRGGPGTVSCALMSHAPESLGPERPPSIGAARPTALTVAPASVRRLTASPSGPASPPP